MIIFWLFIVIKIVKLWNLELHIFVQNPVIIHNTWEKIKNLVKTDVANYLWV